MPTKRMVCLANSRKLSGRCIAGKELGPPRAWVRPVSARPLEEVSEYERQYEDGSDPKVLDVIDVPLIEPRPKAYQTENWLLDPKAYWKKVERVSWGHLGDYLDAPATLWTPGFSTFAGSHDRVPVATANQLHTSLYLVRAEGLELNVSAPGAQFGNPQRRVQGCFVHQDTEYRLRVTDPLIEREYLRRPNGTYPLGPAILTVSLGEPYEGFSYKLIAAVILPPAEEHHG